MATGPHLGTLIKRARERRRWTQRQLADAVGVNVKTIDNWEAGRTSPRNRLGALEQVLGIALYEERNPAPEELVPQDDWETGVLSDPDLPDDIKRRFILDSRASRAAYSGPSRSPGTARTEHRGQPGAARSAGRHRAAG